MNKDPQERMQWGRLGPQVVLVHQALQGHRDLQDHQVKSFFAKVHLEMVGFQAM